jgi:hypothetical protein
MTAERAEWTPFDYDARDANPLPTPGELVWIVEEFYGERVVAGYFDGFTWRVWHGSDDCSVTHWMPMTKPEEPK